jgi:hypothetical protein
MTKQNARKGSEKLNLKLTKEQRAYYSRQAKLNNTTLDNHLSELTSKMLSQEMEESQTEQIIIRIPRKAHRRMVMFGLTFNTPFAKLIDGLFQPWEDDGDNAGFNWDEIEYWGEKAFGKDWPSPVFHGLVDMRSQGLLKFTDLQLEVLACKFGCTEFVKHT